MTLHQASYTLRYTRTRDENFCSCTGRSRTLRLYVNADKDISSNVLKRKMYYEGTPDEQEVIKLHKFSLYYYEFINDMPLIEDAFVQDGNYMNISYKYKL